MYQTRFPYRVILADGTTKINYDFVRESHRYYYYQDGFEITKELYQGLLDTYDCWRSQARAGMPDFDWNQFCKLPYLTKSLTTEKNLRWPIMFNDQEICCGGGRCVVVKIFDLPVKIDRIICSTAPLAGLIALESVADIESLLMQKEFWHKHMKSGRWWNFKVKHGAIVAHDVSRTKNTFPFVVNSGKNKRLLQEVQDLVLNRDLEIESLLQVLSTLPLAKISRD